MIKADLSEPMYFEHDMSINVSFGHYYSHFPMHWHSFMKSLRRCPTIWLSPLK